MIYLIVGDSMASRMDRYQGQAGRSTRNENLYRRLSESGDYSNIEGIATIDKTNEIDITRVKEMLKNRENYQKQRQYSRFIEEKPEVEEQSTSPIEEEKNYDIKEVLDKAKETHNEPNEEYRSLKNIRYDILDRLNLKATPEEEQELKELIDTIAMRNIQENGDDLGLLDDLKSDTMVGDVTSIKKIINDAKEEEAKLEEKQKEEEREEEFNTSELDKSFYTSSMEFSSKDFEGLKDLGQNLKKHNTLLTILIVIFVLLIVTGILIFIVK